MGADQASAMRPAIVEVLESSDGDTVWCATFEIASDPARWVQVTREALNVAYPIVAPPAHLVSGHERLVKLEVSDWKPNEYATFELPEDASPMEIAHLADALFTTILGCADDYCIDVSMQRLV
jgi:hypothetical protein